ncbi:MAG: OadG family transporter subunit [Rubrivivax sp.]|nr:OadG family transporter subunit [Rubrivivax sp.]
MAQNLWAAAELLVGFALVMFTLALLFGLTVLISRVIARLERPAPAAAPTASTAPTPPSTSAARTDGTEDAGASGEEMAAVAAAVALMIDRPHRVVRVLPQPSAWGQQGRRDAHSSHHLS